MGALKVGILLFFILGAIGGYIATHPSILKDLNIDIKFTKGSDVVWTNSNFSTVAASPHDHAGENVDLKAMVFNVMPKNGRVDKNAMEIEAYMGNTVQLQKSPMDTSKRLYISYNPTTLNYTPTLGKCIEIKGTVAGQVSLLTAGGSKLYPVYIKAYSINEIPCSNMG